MSTNILDQFNKDWQDVGVVQLKNFIFNLPDWEVILNALNQAIRSQQPPTVIAGAYYEIVHKDLLAVKKLKYDDENPKEFSIESEATFFFSLFFNPLEIRNKISESIADQIDNMNDVLNINASFNSLKISLSDKFVPLESHTWHTCIIQFKGLNSWHLKDDRTNLNKLYVLEPGDCLFFKEGVEHAVSNEAPRSSLVGRFNFNDGEE